MFIILYFYRFNQIREDQAVVSCDTSNNIFSPGTLIQEWRDFLLCLGEEVSRPELISARYSFVDPKVIVQLCQDTTIDMIHRMVYERFSSYKDVIPLFFWSDIQLLLKHRLSKNQGNSKWSVIARNEAIHTKKQNLWQILHIVCIDPTHQFTNSPIHQLTHAFLTDYSRPTCKKLSSYPIWSGTTYFCYSFSDISRLEQSSRHCLARWIFSFLCCPCRAKIFSTQSSTVYEKYKSL